MDNIDVKRLWQNYVDTITKHYVDFTGRVGVKQYWYFVLVNFVIAIVLAIVGSAAGFAIGKGAGPSWNELRRYEALSGREGEIRGRDAGWNQGRKQGRTEMQFLAVARLHRHNLRQTIPSGDQLGAVGTTLSWA